MKRTLYFGNPVYLSLKDKQILIKYPEEDHKVRSASIEDTAILILDNPRITITSPLLQELLNFNVAVVQCDQKHLPKGIFYNMQGHNKHLEVLNYQLSLSKHDKDILWQKIIKSKIWNQMTLLNMYNRDTTKMNYFLKKVSPGDTKNHEAQAANYYWGVIYNDFIEYFNRDFDAEGINAGLNFGYAIVRSLCARALVATGLYPVLGIFHSNKYNKFCLADDIMEPFRPWVDREVRLILEYSGKIDLNNKEVKKKLLSVPQKDVKLGSKIYPLMKAVERTTSSLKKSIMNNETIILPEFP